MSRSDAPLGGAVPKPIDLILITGFLGAGKTTLLNRLLAGGGGDRSGLLVNDFGDIAVDGSLIKSRYREEEEIEVFEVSDGSIFCTCRSANFVLGLRMFARLRPERLYVEASGMSDPSGIGRLLSENRLAADYRVFRVVCLIDAVRTPRLWGTLPALQRQLALADLVLINKTDLVEDSDLEELERTVREEAPDALVVRTVHAEVDPELLAGPPHREVDGSLVSCNTPSNRPVSLRLPAPDSGPDALKRDTVDAFLRDRLEETWRIKGWISVSGRWWYVSDNAGRLEWREDPLPEGQEPGLVLICPPGGGQNIADGWRALTAGKGAMI